MFEPRRCYAGGIAFDDHAGIDGDGGLRWVEDALADAGPTVTAQAEEVEQCGIDVDLPHKAVVSHARGCVEDDEGCEFVL